MVFECGTFRMNPGPPVLKLVCVGLTVCLRIPDFEILEGTT
jgi:hypothetical protein